MKLQIKKQTLKVCFQKNLNSYQNNPEKIYITINKETTNKIIVTIYSKKKPSSFFFI